MRPGELGVALQHPRMEGSAASRPARGRAHPRVAAARPDTPRARRPAVGPIESEHELRVQPLPERVLAREPLEVGDQVSGVDPSRAPRRTDPRTRRAAARSAAGSREPRSRRRRTRVGDRRARAEALRRGASVPTPGRPRTAGPSPRRRAIRNDRRRPRRASVWSAVAVRVRDEDTPLLVVAEQLAQLRDIHPEDLSSRSRRVARPECGDDRVQRDDLVAPDQEHREERLLPRRSQIDHTVPCENFERPEKPELHKPF